jgi:hypothetical protein
MVVLVSSARFVSHICSLCVSFTWGLCLIGPIQLWRMLFLCYWLLWWKRGVVFRGLLSAVGWVWVICYLGFCIWIWLSSGGCRLFALGCMAIVFPMCRQWCSLNGWWFSCCFFMCRNLNSSFILTVCTFRRMCLAAGELLGIFILA